MNHDTNWIRCLFGIYSTGAAASFPLVKSRKDAGEGAGLLTLLHHQHERVGRVPVRGVFLEILLRGVLQLKLLGFEDPVCDELIQSKIQSKPKLHICKLDVLIPWPSWCRRASLPRPRLSPPTRRPRRPSPRSWRPQERGPPKICFYISSNQLMVEIKNIWNM